MTDQPIAPRTSSNGAPTSRTLSTLTTLALGMSVLIVAQAAMGLFLISGTKSVETIHGWVGYALFLTSLVGAVFAFRFARESGRKGIFYHAVSIPVLLVLQIGLAEMRAEAVHITVGVVLLVAVVGLWTMLRKAA